MQSIKLLVNELYNPFNVGEFEYKKSLEALKIIASMRSKKEQQSIETVIASLTQSFNDQKLMTKIPNEVNAPNPQPY